MFSGSVGWVYTFVSSSRASNQPAEKGKLMPRLFGRFLVCVVAVVLTDAAHAESKSLDVFTRRIVPIMNSAKPSSCAECHLSGVDLKDYIRADQSETFAALVKAGLIDAKQPKKSKLLEFISRTPEKPSLITADVRKEELAAFTAWIEEAARDPELLKAKAGSEKLGPKMPIEVIRHARQDRVLASFIDNVWVEATRCAACHSPQFNKEQVQKHGEQVSWMTPDDPAATLKHLVEAGLIDTKEPTKSLILQKPTMQVKHGGGIKMVVGDRSYKQFRKFLEDYAAMSGGQYTTAKELPKQDEEDSRIGEVWFKLTDVPESFDQQLLQVDLYRQDKSSKTGWSNERWATSDRQVFGKGKLWQHTLSLTAPRDSARAKELVAKPTLPPGKYLVKVYVDRTGRLEQDWRAELGQRDFVGQIEVDSRWPGGYGSMTTAKFPMRTGR